MTELPTRLSRPAIRALVGAGLTSLEAIGANTEPELLRLHGLGPSAIPVLRQALRDANISSKL